MADRPAPARRRGAFLPTRDATVRGSISAVRRYWRYRCYSGFFSRVVAIAPFHLKTDLVQNRCHRRALAALRRAYWIRGFLRRRALACSVAGVGAYESGACVFEHARRRTRRNGGRNVLPPAA